MALKKVLRVLDPTESFHQRMRDAYGHNYEQRMEVHLAICDLQIMRPQIAEWKIRAMALLSLLGVVLAMIGSSYLGHSAFSHDLGEVLLGYVFLITGLTVIFLGITRLSKIIGKKVMG